MEIIIGALVTVATLLGGVATVRMLMRVDELTQEFVKPVARGFLDPRFRGDSWDS